jgi:hypothetical protein
MKSFQWEESCSMRADGRKDGQATRYEEIITFRNFAIGPKNETRWLLLIGQKPVDQDGLRLIAVYYIQ